MQKTILLSFALSTLLLQADELSEKKSKLEQALGKSNSFNQKDFVPDISLILSGSAVSRNIKNSDYDGYGIDGFVNSSDEILFNKDRGFNFNYAEFGMHSDVGPYFEADAIFHLRNNDFEIEEAYITSKKLPANLQLKAGRFRSSFGRMNRIHAHAQHFMAQPLVYEAMIGVDGLKDAGLSLQWVAPTDTYLMLGVEALQGTNELSFGYPEENNLYVGYLKSGFDLSENDALLVGGSIAQGKTVNNENSKLYNAELTLKHTIDSYGSLSWQSEYLYRDKENQKQAGVYTQLLYAPNRTWEFGGRYDGLSKNIANHADDLKKYSAITSYKPFEFTKIRLQYSHDKSKSFGGFRRTEDFIGLEFLVETGSHGAHAF